MRMPRFRIRTMMILIAVGTVISAILPVEIVKILERRAACLYRAESERSLTAARVSDASAYAARAAVIKKDYDSGVSPPHAVPYAEYASWKDYWKETIEACTRHEKSARRLAAFHTKLAAKYERAARYPWLPVEPDPPEPK